MFAIKTMKMILEQIRTTRRNLHMNYPSKLLFNFNEDDTHEQNMEI